MTTQGRVLVKVTYTVGRFLRGQEGPIAFVWGETVMVHLATGDFWFAFDDLESLNDSAAQQLAALRAARRLGAGRSP